ncbi:MAG: hypothetical protein IAF08_07505 [Rhizobacter sp.]|nr:hypothetical protein [Chlorobiales bacterium]
MKIHLVVTDFIFRSQIEVAAKNAGVEIAFIHQPSDVQSEDARMAVVFDLSTVSVETVKFFREKFPAAEMLGFLPHVDGAKRESAEAVGCKVMSRFEFSKNLPAILRNITSAPA